MSDLISRQAAIAAIEFDITYAKAINKETGEVTQMFERENKALEDAVERVRQLPPIQPIQPKRGRWTTVTNGRGGHECDQCHNYAPSYQTGEEHLSDFCPNCGADMREVTT